MSDTERTGFYVVIPAIVRMCGSIPDGAKLLFGDLCGLAKKEGYCYATNNALAEITNVKPSTVRDYLRHLESAGFITREKGKLRRIFVVGVSEICHQPLSDIQHHTNTSITNTNTIASKGNFFGGDVTEEMIEDYFTVEKHLSSVQAKSEAESCFIWHDERGNFKDGKYKSFANTWYKNAVGRGRITPQGEGKTREEIANPDTGLIDTSRWEPRGILYYRR